MVYSWHIHERRSHRMWIRRLEARASSSRAITGTGSSTSCSLPECTKMHGFLCMSKFKIFPSDATSPRWERATPLLELNLILHFETVASPQDKMVATGVSVPISLNWTKSALCSPDCPVGVVLISTHCMVHGDDEHKFRCAVKWCRFQSLKEPLPVSNTGQFLLLSVSKWPHIANSRLKRSCPYRIDFENLTLTHLCTLGRMIADVLQL